MRFVQSAIQFGVDNPKKLFLIDGAGALCSALLLGIVLVELEPFFGIPRRTLYFLALFPVLFALYDGYCYLKEPRRIGVFLRGIALMNLFYCCISIGAAICHRNELTGFGWTYMTLELMIVIALATFEYRVATSQSPSRQPSGTSPGGPFRK